MYLRISRMFMWVNKSPSIKLSLILSKTTHSQGIAFAGALHKKMCTFLFYSDKNKGQCQHKLHCDASDRNEVVNRGDLLILI